MTTILVAFDVAFSHNNLSHYEKHPSLFCYLSGHVIRREEDYAELSLGKDMSAKVSGHVSDRNCGISANTALCFALFGWREDSNSKVNCKVCLGTDRVLLSELVDERQHKPRTLFMKMHTVDNYEKARLTLTVRKIDIQGLRFKHDRLDVKAAERDLNIYYQTIQRTKQQMGETLEGTDRMDAPYDFSESGFFIGSMPVPFLAFALRELPETNLAMWESCLTIVLKRDRMTVYDFFQLTEKGKARTLATLITLIPSYLDYTSDIILKDSQMDAFKAKRREEGAEIFGANRCTGADCEDTGNMNAEILESFSLFNFDNTLTQIGQALQTLQRIAKNYVALRSLDVVRGAQVSDKTGYQRLSFFVFFAKR
jgi:hypothetical protein